MTSAIIAFDASKTGTLDSHRLRACLNPGLHSVVHDLLDEDGTPVLDGTMAFMAAKVIQTSDIAEAERLYREAQNAGISARVNPSAEAFGDDLAGYLDALNIEARYFAEFPRPGWIVPGLTEDLDHWARSGIHTALDLAQEFGREAEKAARKSWDWE